MVFYFNMAGHTKTPGGFYSFKVLHLHVWSVASVPTETVTGTHMFSAPPIKRGTYLDKNKYNLYNCNTSGSEYKTSSGQINEIIEVW